MRRQARDVERRRLRPASSRARRRSPRGRPVAAGRSAWRGPPSGAAVAGASAREAVAPSCVEGRVAGIVRQPGVGPGVTVGLWPRVAVAARPSRRPRRRRSPAASMTRQKATAPMTRARLRRRRAWRVLPDPSPCARSSPPQPRRDPPLLTRWASLSASSIPVGTGPGPRKLTVRALSAPACTRGAARAADPTRAPPSGVVRPPPPASAGCPWRPRRAWSSWGRRAGRCRCRRSRGAWSA